MVWVVLLDEQLNLLRPHDTISDRSCFTLCKTLAKRVISGLCSTVTDSFVTIVQPNWSENSPKLTTFSDNVPTLHLAIDQLEEPNPLVQQKLNDLVLWTLTEVFRYWGPSATIQILLFTDGGASPFLHPAPDDSVASQLPWLPKMDQSNASLTVITLSDDQVSPDILRTYRQFLPRSGILSWKKYQQTNGGAPLTEDDLGSFADYCVRTCLVNHGFGRNCEVSLRCGHLNSSVQLAPVLRITDYESSESPTSLRLEIFGFLHTSDLSNPPVVSRHHVSNVSDENRTPFLQLLTSALQETKTVAMCSIYAGETNSSASGTCTKSTHADGRNDAANLLRHGFVHQVDPKASILMLSVFPKDCIGLPWLGQFQHLAPVEDFAGVQLYDDREGSSPFPVLVPDRLSYGTLSDSNVGQNRAAPAGSEPFRYVSWVSPTSLLSEVNKVLRLGRRLPEKSALFFKELARLRSAALAYGCPELLVHVAHLTESAHATENPLGQAQSDAVRVHLDAMNRMLSEAAAQLDD
ncbi:hypothetical protein T265_04847 [Opisthorchis viverrini]|uniref:Integrator complex subunit 14 n=1 Tax=Opisthorchis viverrini TaxID=6198 RepID=A0A074ZLS9_OPIVI|nr:hypothetical protein T265_04847 [Opisthorchis viverrini]KER28318.1 hypothetical protein T265_04847 [Opisthorchis viverrini]